MSLEDAIRDILQSEMEATLRRVLPELLQQPREPLIEKPRLSVKEAADYLGLGQSTVRKLLAAGRLERTTIGRRVVIARDACDRYLEDEQCRNAGAAPTELAAFTLGRTAAGLRKSRMSAAKSR